MTMTESEMPVPEAPDSEPSESRTVEVPVAIAGNLKPGDILRLRAVSANGETVTCENASDANTGGSQKMAQEFDQEETEETD